MTVPARVLGRRVVAVEDLTRPWSTAVRTSRVTLDDGRSVVHQAGRATSAGRAGIARRIRAGHALRAVAPELRVPAVLDGDAAARPPFLVTAFVPGRSGGELLGSEADAAALGRVAGQTARAVAEVPRRRLGTPLPSTWAEADRLRPAAASWVAAASTVRPRGIALAAAEATLALRVLGRVPLLFAEAPVLAHGDLAPVNLVFDGERLAGLLDLERIRVAPAGFDAAWFRLIVRHHHPGRWAAAGPAFLAAAGLADDPAVLARLDDLALLACLEQAAGLAARSPARTAWIARAVEILRGELPGP